MDLVRGTTGCATGDPRGDAGDRGLIETVTRDPNHPGANHLYIHALEPTTTPARAGRPPDLLKLMPGAGHMVHMPSHIYQRVGRYADAVASNELAVAADEDYIAQCRAQGLYPMGYYPHNIHFLWFAATMEGRSEVAIDAARKTASKVEDEMLAQLPLLAAFRSCRTAPTRFGRWDEMLAEPEPPAGSLYLTAPGTTRAAWPSRPRATRRRGARARGLAPPLPDKPRLHAVLAQHRRASSALAPGAGRRAGRAREYDDAIAHSSGPCAWRTPRLHRARGVALPAAARPRRRAARGRPRGEAETVYWEDLRRPRQRLVAVRPRPGAAGPGQGRRAAPPRPASEGLGRADVKLTASRFGRPVSVSSRAAGR